MQQNRQNVARVFHQLWKGTLAPPEILEDYERLLPGMAERLLTLAEREQKSRHVDDREAESIVKENIKQSAKEPLRG